MKDINNKTHNHFLEEGRKIGNGQIFYGGFPKLLNEAKKSPKAKKDWDKDGKIESEKDEYFGSRMRAAKQKGKMVEESTIINDQDIIENLLEELFSDEDLHLLEAAIEKKKWIQKAIKKEGALRKTMKTKEGKTIPVSKLKKAAEKGGKTGKRARLALTLRKLNEGGVVGQFNDADDTSPTDERIATHPDTITWNAEFEGTKYPSQSYAELAGRARTLGRQLSSAHELARSQFGPNYMQSANFMQQPKTISLLQQRNAAEEAVKKHPHFAEAQKGHPSTRMADLSKEEKDLFELEGQYGTSYSLDPVTRKPIYGKRPIGGLGT